MKKHYNLIAGMLALVASASAQVSLPRAVYTLDFEGATIVADVNATQVGDGELRVSTDPNFGTYYQNAPNAAVKTPGKNYLLVKQSALANAVSKTKDGCISLGFWVNGTVANTQYPDINTYYSVLFTFYNESSISGTTYPVFSVNKRLWMQINTAGAWDDFTDAENINGANYIDATWMDQKTEEQTTQNELGEEIVNTINTPFEDNWHYVALSFNSNEATTSLFVDGEMKNKWTNKDGYYTTENFFGQLLLNKFDCLLLGGVAQWGWNDPDPAFAYDDFTVYAGDLNEEQQQLVMKIKSGQIDDDTRLALAQMEYLDAVSGYEDIAEELGNYDALSSLIGDQMMEIDDQLFTSPSVEGYQEGAKKVIALVDKAVNLMNAIEAAKSAIDREKDYAAATNYPGFDAYIQSLTEAEALVADPTEMEAVDSANEAISIAKIVYVTSQEMPADGTGINITAIVRNPWFCNPDAEPTETDGTFTFPYIESHGYAENTTPADYNSTGWINGNTFAATDARVNWTIDRICWNNWHDKTIVGTLDVHQNIANLPAGYYTVSADLVTNVTGNQHSYALSNGVKKVSAPLNYNGWDARNWKTLTTDKVYVGEDGILTIGVESSATGAAYSGFFCATNFVVTYFGTEVDLTADLKAKQEEVAGLINEMILAGDKKNAEAKSAEIAANEDTYMAIAQYTELASEINATIASEQAFSAVESLTAAASASSSANVKAAFKAACDNITSVLSADTTTVNALPSLNALANAVRAYAEVVTEAEGWNDAELTALYTEQIAGIATAENEATIVAYKEELLKLMKAAIGNNTTASEDNPLNITFTMANPSFIGDNTAGWTIGQGSSGVAYEECEFFNQNFNIFQVIKGLPTGYYRVAVQGFYRDGTNEQAYEKANTTPTPEEETESEAPARRFAGSNNLNAQLYAKVGEATKNTPIMSWAEFMTTGEEFNGYWSPNATDETVDAENVLYFANTMEAANILFNKGMNADGNVVDIYLEEGNDLTVGVMKNTTISNDWTIFDNFHLYYLGANTPTGIQNLEANESKTVGEAVFYNINGARIAKPAKGINIMRQRMADGSVRTTKVFIK